MDEPLLLRCLRLNSKTTAPIPDGCVRVFDEDIKLADLHSHEHTQIPVDIGVENKELVVLAPRSLESPRPKRRKTNAKEKKARLRIASISLPDQCLQDAVLAQDLKRCAFPLTAVKGPELAFRGTEAYLSFGVWLLPESGPLSSSWLATQAVPRLLSRVCQDVTLIDPQKYMAQAVELFDVISERKVLGDTPDVSPRGLLTPLLPFQRDTLKWCLRKEGQDLDNEGKVVPLDSDVRDLVISPPLGWRQVPLHEIWINPFMLQTTRTEPRIAPIAEHEEYRGKGLLAEEMGLGKTLEMIALMMLNPRQNPTEKKIAATLVIVPPAILTQWENELATHSPNLRLFVYPGRQNLPDGVRLSDYDVVLVSYPVIASEVYSALFDPGKRNTRFWRQRTDIDCLRSPLVQFEWWRVVLDEVQMIHTGVNNAAKVARLVPRVHAWGVTGTPVKNSISDLRGLLVFLDVQPFVELSCLNRMLASPLEFRYTMSQLSIRHTKPQVSSQLHLPPQRRQLVSLQFSEIERHHYDTIYQQFKSRSRQPPTDGASNRLSSWLLRLRQACCHASLVQSHRDASAPVLTIEQVQAKLVDDAEDVVYSKLRHRMTSQLELGQLLDRVDRLHDAIDLWVNLVNEIKEQMAKHERRFKALSEDSIVRFQFLNKLLDEEAELAASDPENSTLRSIGARVLEASHAANYANARVSGSRRRIRSLQELLHRTLFFIATGYYRMNERLEARGDPPIKEYQEEEAKYYGFADDLRAEILAEAAERVNQERSRMLAPEVHYIKNFKEMPQQTTVLNGMANFIKEMDNELHKILSLPLLEMDSDRDVYADSLNVQERAHELLDVLQLVVKDRSKAAQGGSSPANPKEEKRKWSDSYREMLERRADFQAVVHEMPSVSEVIRRFGGKVDSDLTALRREIKDWGREIAATRDLLNARVEYYRQLQMLSDRVVDVDIPPDADVRKVVQDKRAAFRRAEQAIVTSETKLRYLRSLEPVAEVRSGSVKPDTTEDEDEDLCPICQDTYTMGSLTVCGHKFCTACITKWWAVRHTCPLCKRKLAVGDMFKFRKGGDAGIFQGPAAVEVHDLSNEIYAQIPNSLYNELMHQPLVRSYGIKIDTIVRHVKYLRAQDPTAQVVVFSQWAPMLKMLDKALWENELGAVGIGNGGAAKFRQDPGLACFLLHAKSEAAGLTLVNACHVFLCEPLITTALELQAISRIHRIGQTQPTTVWLFSVENSVEQAILEITTRRRVQELLNTQTNEDAADSSILASSTGRLVDRASGSELVSESDVKRILYHSFDKATTKESAFDIINSTPEGTPVQEVNA